MIDTLVTILLWYGLIDLAVSFVACTVALGTVVYTAVTDYWRYVRNVREDRR